MASTDRDTALGLNSTSVTNLYAGGAKQTVDTAQQSGTEDAEEDVVDDWEDEAEVTGGQEKEAGDDWEEDWESCDKGVSHCLTC